MNNQATPTDKKDNLPPPHKIVEDVSLQNIRDAVESGDFFKEAFEWYFARYVRPLCDRTILIICAIIAIFVLNSLYTMFKNTFPLVVSKPIFTSGHDQSLYFPKITKLRPKAGEKGYDADLKTVDDSVIKYLISNYIKDREGYDFSKGEIEEVNNKINRIKNLSSDQEFGKFYGFMGEENPESPINYFGRKIKKIITIDSVKFTRIERRSAASKVFNYFKLEIPLEASVNFTATTSWIDDDGKKNSSEEKFFVKIGYEYEPINFNPSKKDNNQKSLKFLVRKYDLYRPKQK